LNFEILNSLPYPIFGGYFLPYTTENEKSMNLASSSLDNIKSTVAKAATVVSSFAILITPLVANAATFGNQINSMPSKQLIAQFDSRPSPPLSSLNVSNGNCYFGGVCDGTPGGHTGVDYQASVGTAVQAICDGTVKISRTETSTPNVRNRFTIIEHPNCAGYQVLYGYYGHINASVRVNQQVRKGDVIGYVASYGRNNNHLHFGVATTYFTSGWGYGLKQQGWIDPASIFR
jgi:hypothetical protein